MKLTKLPILALLVVAIIIINPMLSAANLPSGSIVKAILQERIDKEKQSVGIVVGLINPQNSKIINYGKLSQSSSQAVNGDTIFEIGSVSKVFTTLLLADMVERKQLNLKDPISKLLPKSVTAPTRKGKEITLVDLATHTSGLPRLPNNLKPKDIENPYADYTIEQLYSFLSNYQLPRDIGTKYEYSNLGVGLLGHILSLKTGIDYEKLVVTRIAKPLQMNSTQIQISSEMQPRFATGHNQKLEAVKYWDIPTLAGAGALHSTANDLLKFVAANLGLIKSSLSSAMQLSQQVVYKNDISNLSMGLGWHIMKKDNREIIWHNGGTGGFHSFIGFDKNKRIGVVVLSNSINNIDDIGLHLLNKNIPLTKTRNF
ncbi:beta-lactamase [Calothrix sp. NIES-4071]|nr:beta-lactamase [Calothrix sp. NIES-4071]BAZ62602.1 beta-lactamase [Calothrix sp. NIES-4105]